MHALLLNRHVFPETVRYPVQATFCTCLALPDESFLAIRKQAGRTTRAVCDSACPESRWLMLDRGQAMPRPRNGAYPPFGGAACPYRTHADS